MSNAAEDGKSGLRSRPLKGGQRSRSEGTVAAPAVGSEVSAPSVDEEILLAKEIIAGMDKVKIVKMDQERYSSFRGA